MFRILSWLKVIWKIYMVAHSLLATLGSLQTVKTQHKRRNSRGMSQHALQLPSELMRCGLPQWRHMVKIKGSDVSSYGDRLPSESPCEGGGEGWECTGGFYTMGTKGHQRRNVVANRDLLLITSALRLIGQCDLTCRRGEGKFYS